MNQVQVLPVDMPVVTDNKGLGAGTEKDASKGSDDFGAILAKHNVDSGKGGNSGKESDVNGKSVPTDKEGSSQVAADNSATDVKTTKKETANDGKRLDQSKDKSADSDADISIPSEKELKLIEALAEHQGSERSDTSEIKSGEQIVNAIDKQFEHKPMPSEVAPLPDEITAKATKETQKEPVVSDSLEHPGDEQTNKLLELIKGVKDISTEHVKLDHVEKDTVNVAKQIHQEVPLELAPAKNTQSLDKVQNVELFNQEKGDSDNKLPADKTVVAKAVEQNIHGATISTQAPISNNENVTAEASATAEAEATTVNSQNSELKSLFASTTNESTTGTVDSDEVKSETPVKNESTTVNTHVSAELVGKKEAKITEASSVVTQSVVVKAENQSETVETKSDTAKSAQFDNSVSAKTATQTGGNAQQNADEGNANHKQQSAQFDKAASVEAKMASSFSDASTPNLVAEKSEKAATTSAPTSVTSTPTSVASAQAFVDKLTMEANPVMTAKQQAAVADVISIHRPDFSNAVKEKVMVMVNQQIRQLDIRLDPPELGGMQIKVNMQNEQAVVSFMVQNQSAKEAVEQQLAKFKEMMADSGVDVGEANVSQQQEKDQGELAEQQNGDKGSLHGQEDLDDELTVNPAQLYKASSTGVGYFV